MVCVHVYIVHVGSLVYGALRIFVIKLTVLVFNMRMVHV